MAAHMQTYTSLGVRAPAINGPAIPGKVAMQFEIPINNPEYLGPISIMFTLNPLHTRPPIPTPKINNITAALTLVV